MEMPLDVEWTSKATRDLRRMAAKERGRIILRVEQYAAKPEYLRNQVTCVAGSDYLRLRVALYRLLFMREGGAVAIMVLLRARHRREAYV